MKGYDLLVIGSGTAAQVASARVRAAGWQVAVIDHVDPDLTIKGLMLIHARNARPPTSA